jgi:Flp pilus assembly protein TadD
MTQQGKIGLKEAAEAMLEGKTLRERAGLSRDLIRVLYASAVTHYESGQHEDALVTLSQIMALEPRNADIWALMGNCMLKLGRFGDAVLAWRVAMTVAPSFATAATIVRTAVAIKDAEASAEALMVARRQRTTPKQFTDYEALLDLWNRQFAPELAS